MISWFRRKAAAPPLSSPGAAEWRSRGNAALQSGQLAAARDCYEKATSLDGDDAASWLNLGFVLLEEGNVAAAADSLQRAVLLAAAQPELRADAAYLLGRAQAQLGQGAAAIASLQQALQARPVFPEAAQDLAPMLLASGRSLEAAAALEAVARARPDDLQVQLSWAQCLHAAARGPDALAVLDAAAAKHRDDPAVLSSRGSVLLEAGRAAEALVDFERVLQAQGRTPDALANASGALAALDRAGEAQRLAEEAIAMDPRHGPALHNRALALMRQLRVQVALSQAERAAAIHPHDPDLLWLVAVGHLLLGDLPAGWRAHEARWHAKGFLATAGRPPTSQPQWSGEQPLEGRTILLYGEQGLGDTIQFLRYAWLVAQRAREVLLRVQPAVLPLLGGLPSNCRVLDADRPLPPHDLQCPLLSLPHAFGTTLGDVPARVPYLHADEGRTAQWRDTLAATRSPRVGIVWSGNPGHGNDRNRSIPLQLLRAIDPGGVQFVALQPQVRDSDAGALAGWAGLVDAGPQLRDFGQTAALIQALDLVVSVDTSVAHLAGALGKPVWILLPHVPDWRWMLERSDSPWYPTARLYRQQSAGEWRPVLERVRADLAQLRR